MWCWGGDYQILHSSRPLWCPRAIAWPARFTVSIPTCCCGGELCFHPCGPSGLPFTSLFPAHSRMARHYSAAPMPCCGLHRSVWSLFLLWGGDPSRDFTRTIDFRFPLLLSLFCGNTWGYCHIPGPWSKQWLSSLLMHIVIISSLSPITKTGGIFLALCWRWEWVGEKAGQILAYSSCLYEMFYLCLASSCFPNSLNQWFSTTADLQGLLAMPGGIFRCHIWGAGRVRMVPSGYRLRLLLKIL